jgi:hypothetical protein
MPDWLPAGTIAALLFTSVFAIPVVVAEPVVIVEPCPPSERWLPVPLSITGEAVAAGVEDG